MPSTSALRADRPSRTITGLIVVAALVAACSHDKAPATAVQPTPCAAAGVLTIAPLQAVTVPAESANCIEMTPGTGSYVIVPQFAIAAPDTNLVSFEIGALSPANAAIAARSAPAVYAPELPALPVSGPRGTFAAAFDHQRRLHANTLAAALSSDPASRWAIAAARVAAVLAPPAVGSSRTFQVCATMTCSSTKPDTAILKFVGTNILLYQSQDAVLPPTGFTDTEIGAFGSVFDQTLYPIDVNAFGAPSDIDNNGRVIVLLSPKVNALTPTNTCQTQGYIAGFFYEADLIPGYPGSNAGEIYYSIAPDPAGTFSCTHTKAEVQYVTGGTFLHETLHLINFASKILNHGLSNTEDEFLDEGMAKVAEELGSRHYEMLYPAPTGRTNASQLFPDSAEGYISGDIYNSYVYLLAPRSHTATMTMLGGSDLPEAGAEWLFLRWLGDQRGEAMYKQIVQSALTGVSNVEAQAGEPFASLFAKAGLTAYTDSIPGLARDQVPAAYRLTTRNIRELNNAIYNAYNPSTRFPRPFALQPIPLTADLTLQGSMMKGTAGYYVYATPASGNALRLHFREVGGGSFPTALGAQVTVFRCPVGVTCQ